MTIKTFYPHSSFWVTAALNRSKHLSLQPSDLKQTKRESPREFVFDNRLRISKLFKFRLFTVAVRVVNFWGIQMFQLFDVPSDVISIRIELDALRPRIENPKPRAWVIARSHAPLPATVIRCKVAINEMLHKISFSKSPIYEEMLWQKRSHDHATTIVHPANSVQLPHCCIDYWDTCAALTPSFKLLWFIFPGNSIVFRFIWSILADMRPSSKYIYESAYGLSQEQYVDKNPSRRLHLSSLYSLRFLCLSFETCCLLWLGECKLSRW